MTLNPYEWRDQITKLHDEMLDMHHCGTFDEDLVLEKMQVIAKSIYEPAMDHCYEMFGWRVRFRLIKAAFSARPWNHKCHHEWLSYVNKRAAEEWEKQALAWYEKSKH